MAVRNLAVQAGKALASTINTLSRRVNTAYEEFGIEVNNLTAEINSLTDNIRKLPPHVYKPFGVGARACIGRQFALHEIMLTLATVIHQFDLEPEPGYELKVSETLTLKPDALRLRLTRRAA